MSEIKTITVVGTGYIGLSTAILMAEAGFEVTGVDINPSVVEKLNARRIHIVEPGLQDLFESVLDTGKLRFTSEMCAGDAFCICVPTPIKVEGSDAKSDLSYVRSAAESIAKVCKAGNLIILESTVPPHATQMVESIVASESGISADEIHCVHCPERVIPGDMIRELKENDRIIGCRTAKGGELAKSIYTKILTKGKVHLTDDVTAATCKLVENTYRDVNIAFANELSIICHDLGIDVKNVIRLANCHPRVNILNPGVGVGGHCIAVDPWFLCEQFPEQSRLIRTARLVNNMKPSWVADRVEETIGSDKSKTICVFGLAYKPNADDLRESPSIVLANELKKRGYKVVACEPFAALGDVKGIENLSFDTALKVSDCNVITLAHTMFKEKADELRQTTCYDCAGVL